MHSGKTANISAAPIADYELSSIIKMNLHSATSKHAAFFNVIELFFIYIVLAVFFVVFAFLFSSWDGFRHTPCKTCKQK